MSRNAAETKTRATYLVCVSDNEHSLVALRFVCRRIEKTGGPLQLLHVLEPVDPTFRALASKMREEKRALAEKFMNKCAAEVNNYANVRPVLTIREGNLVEEIIATIEEESSIGILVIGTSYDSPTRDKMIPALVSQLGDRLMIPLLIIPGTLTEQQMQELT
jgi:nucleotide-binding universal stress UspA family protein